MNAPIRPMPIPIGLLAELTHRCPLRCPYCSNPMALDRRSSELETEDWKRVFGEAAALGVLHVHLSGGEPTARADIAELTAHCAKVGLYTNLITSGVGQASARLPALFDAGLDHVQLSVQGAGQATGDLIGGLAGAHAAKLAFAAEVVRLGLPLTVNAVIHRGNIHEVEAIIALAVAMQAKRLEIAHTQYYGWAYANRAALMPTRAEADASVAVVEAARERLKGTLVIDLVLPDYYGLYPKPCSGGWARRSLNVTPSGKVLPCHAAESIPGLEFWSVREHDLAEIWRSSPAFTAFRGTDWMPEPCHSCERRERDWGGCRCQAMALVGDAAATDPACSKSPHHARMVALATAESVDPNPPPYIYRRIGGTAAEPRQGEPVA
ncbi:pyrroloquinoline quinone biosynthesis protein PqqE [Labrys wisconsinensis]|uniref:PqqA peptide cyclase n=1 Tax=Labrys wisconsinensis TaxID=425677 RepID=A0ABU0IYL6_9HYPH|nr:pyrroloquinoline quinone biosynthesis protein PqqE [Labrys wisconsinensis]MDQ0467110.1 pyrroloquinoline quinone biosynthesis protein E [Labrys wisconsinensis]